MYASKFYRFNITLVFHGSVLTAGRCLFCINFGYQSTFKFLSRFLRLSISASFSKVTILYKSKIITIICNSKLW